jgi:Tfp pilus assembly protein PilX
MIGARAFIWENKGMVLFSSLLIVTLLMVVGMGAFVALQNDYRITANLKQGTAVFYVAEAGIEWAKEQIGKTVAHPPLPEGRLQSFSSGTFSVAFLSSAPVTPLTAKIILRSTGVSGTSSQTVQAQVTKSYDLADGSIVLRGAGAGVGLSGDSLFVSGFDHDPVGGGMVAGAKPRPAISVASASLRAQIEAELGAQQNSTVVGESSTAMSQSNVIPSQTVTRLADALCSAPEAATMTVPTGGVLSLGGEVWGSRSAPQVRCVEGLPGPADLVSIDGNLSGVGILVVRNSQLAVNSAFRWEGLIIVTGADVGFRATGADNKEVYGALIINETGPGMATTPPILTLQGAIRLFYSRSAFSRVAGLLPSSTLAETYISLPFAVTQDYWRSVNP